MVKTGLVINVTWSKVLQFRGKILQVPVHSAPGTPFSLPVWYSLMIARIHATPDQPAFLVPTPTGLVPLTHNTFVTHLHNYLYRAGYDPAVFSGHSFRRGGATFLRNNGFDVHDIMILGDWSSDSVLRYFDHDTDRHKLSSRFTACVMHHYC